MAISPSRLLAAASMACAARCSILRLPFVFPFRTTNKAEGVDPAFPHPRLVTPRPTCRCKCMRPPCIDPSGRHEPPSLLPMRCDCQLCRARSARSALAQGEAMRAGPVSREWAVSPNCPSQPDLAVCAAQALLLRLALPSAAAWCGGFTPFLCAVLRPRTPELVISLSYTFEHAAEEGLGNEKRYGSIPPRGSTGRPRESEGLCAGSTALPVPFSQPSAGLYRVQRG